MAQYRFVLYPIRSPYEVFSLLLTSPFIFKVLRDEYLVKLEVVRSELERRVSTLENRKKAQLATIDRLRLEKEGLRNQAAKLSETYEDLNDANQKLTTRMEKVLQKIQQQLPIRSDSELRMQRQLQDVERKMKKLEDGM